MRRHLLSLLAFASLTCSLAAQSVSSTNDTIPYTTATIRMREKPSPTARPVAILAEGTRVRLYHCSEGWCGVSVQRLAGYALEEFLTTRPTKQVTSHRHNRAAVTSTLMGSGSHRPRERRMGSRLQEHQRSVATGRSVLASIGRARVRIMGE